MQKQRSAKNFSLEQKVIRAFGAKRNKCIVAQDAIMRLSIVNTLA